MPTQLEPNPLAIPMLATVSGRISLRPFTLADAPALYEHHADPRIAATTSLPYPYPEGAAERWIGTHGPAAAAGSDINWAIANSEDDLAIGAISMQLIPEHRRAELGYWLAVPWWGQGLMSDAARTVVAYGFATLGLHRIQARCLPDNIGSAKVMQHAGMRFEGIMRGYECDDGDFVDLAMYAVLSTDS